MGLEEAGGRTVNFCLTCFFTLTLVKNVYNKLFKTVAKGSSFTANLEIKRAVTVVLYLTLTVTVTVGGGRFGFRTVLLVLLSNTLTSILNTLNKLVPMTFLAGFWLGFTVRGS